MTAMIMKKNRDKCSQAITRHTSYYTTYHVLVVALSPEVVAVGLVWRGVLGYQL